MHRFQALSCPYNPKIRTIKLHILKPGSCRYKELVRPWYLCSLTRQCIAPDGSDRSNHRQDQAALTVLAALTKNKCEGIPPEVGQHMDNHDETLVGVDPTTCYQDPHKKFLGSFDGNR